MLFACFEKYAGYFFVPTLCFFFSGKTRASNEEKKELRNIISALFCAAAAESLNHAMGFMRAPLVLTIISRQDIWR